ncbi:hypothetical protein L6V77_26635 [Myxococcota bacterium]|nr:hypothetical protein [Myxococcota bacterium]
MKKTTTPGTDTTDESGTYYSHVEVHPFGKKGRLRLCLMDGSSRLGYLDVSGPSDEKFLRFFNTIYGHRG